MGTAHHSEIASVLPSVKAVVQSLAVAGPLGTRSRWASIQSCSVLIIGAAFSCRICQQYSLLMSRADVQSQTQIGSDSGGMYDFDAGQVSRQRFAFATAHGEGDKFFVTSSLAGASTLSASTLVSGSILTDGLR